MIKKKRKNGRAKGAAFELQVAKLFEKWTGDLVCRTPLSGGWAKEKGFGVGGDLVFTTVTDLHIEVKKQERWELEDLLLGENKRLVRAWWKQAKRECPKGKLPLLVFCRNRLAPLIMFSPEGILRVKPRMIDYCPFRFRCFEFPFWRVNIMTLKDFMKKYRYVGVEKPVATAA